MRLAELKLKHGCESARNEPKPDCRHCQGIGERPIRSGRRKGDMVPCICLFVDHKASDEIGTSLGQFAKRQLELFKKDAGEPKP